MRVWVVVCCDNITGVASGLAKADELYGCGHGEDSFCCFTEERDVDARPVSAGSRRRATGAPWSSWLCRYDRARARYPLGVAFSCVFPVTATRASA